MPENPVLTDAAEASRKLPKTFDPASFEERWYALWESEGRFQPSGPPGSPRFVMVIPPPNVTGKLHIGHAYGRTIEDILARWMRMRGFRVLWVPGTDHAGIATQMVIERQLAKQGIDRKELGREKFVERVWAWKREAKDTIQSQLKKLGCSLDWTRERFTLDPDLSRAVRHAFVRLYREGLITRGRYVVNWCPRCGTAVSDLEVIRKEEMGTLYKIRYGWRSTRRTRGRRSSAGRRRPCRSSSARCRSSRTRSSWTGSSARGSSRSRRRTTPTTSRPPSATRSPRSS